MSRENKEQGEIVRQDCLQLSSSSKAHGEKGIKRLLYIVGVVWRNPLPICIIFLILWGVFWIRIAPGIGKGAGLAIGSWKGVTQGINEGTEAGREAGLSAEDTEVRIGNKIASGGNLQVLLVDFRLTDLYQQGDDYVALMGIKGTGIFSVDLTQSQTVYSEAQNKITITIPELTFFADLDDSSLEIYAEYVRPFFNGSTVNGYHGYLNSREQIDQHIQEELYGYDAMVKQARSSALNQVELLARSVCGSTASVEVRFIDGEG